MALMVELICSSIRANATQEWPSVGRAGLADGHEAGRRIVSPYPYLDEVRGIGDGVEVLGDCPSPRAGQRQVDDQGDVRAASPRHSVGCLRGALRCQSTDCLLTDIGTASTQEDLLSDQ
jgi:hypothetical protein